MNQKIYNTLKELDKGDIRDLDKDHEWEKFIINSCNVDFEEYYFQKKKNLTHTILEENLDNILNNILKFKEYIYNPYLSPETLKPDSWVLSIDDIHIGFQILGLLIIETGANMPYEVYDSIMISTKWEYDKTRKWAKYYEKHRKKNLEIFRNLVILYKNKKKTL